MRTLFSAEFIELIVFMLLVLSQIALAQKTQTLLDQAKTAIEEKKFDEAVAALDKISTSEPNNEDALTQKARVSASQKGSRQPAQRSQKFSGKIRNALEK